MGARTLHCACFGRARARQRAAPDPVPGGTWKSLCPIETLRSEHVNASDCQEFEEAAL
jgi:hypothetical protein